jgi:phosphinothricin acetyltransferase
MANRRLIFLSFQLPLIVGFAALFLVAHCGDEGRMHTPVLESIAGSFTDLKFHVRGKRPLDHKIVIVEIDEEALDQVGRWPWHRDAMAVLIQSAFDAGARVVGLDIVFAEPDVRVPEALADLLRENHLDDRIATFETEPRTPAQLAQQIIDKGDRFPTVVVERDGRIVAWAGAGAYRSRPAYAGVAEHSVYVARSARGTGAGRAALEALCQAYAERGFWKIVSRIFPENTASLALHERCGFRVVGVYQRHGKLEGQWRDCVIVERLIGAAAER